MEQGDLQLLLDHASDVHWMVDVASGSLLYVSPAAVRRLGCAPEQVLARAAALAAPLLLDLPARLARYEAGDVSRVMLLRETELAGIPVEIESRLVPGADGLRLVGVVRDISARRAFEQQQKKFASMLSHEFRTPLATIDGAIQRLVMTDAGADPAVTKRYLKIQSAADRLLAMLDEYLSPERLSAIGRTRRDNGIAPADFLEAAAAAARPRRADITVQVGDVPRWLRADPEGLRLCLDRLLDNAIQYSLPGSPIALACAMAMQGGVELSVTDSGRPIPDDEVSHLFERGYRGSNAAGTQGSGLGLYMAKAIIDVHGGTIAVQNLPESGKKFTIWLPIAA
jgi:two-component system phosphate regulon sensor histidine kinase PhoR